MRRSRPFPVGRLLLALALGWVRGSLAEAPPFATLAAEPETIYAGQPFTLLLSLYTSGQDLEPGMRIGGLPEVLQVQPFQEMAPATETVEGRTYQVLRMKCEAICPDPGVLPFSPLIQGTLTRTIQNLIFTQRISTHFQAPVKPFQLTVKAVPLDRAPPDYTGAIGSFTLTAACSTNRFLPGDLITLSFTVQGRGRFDRLPALGLPPTEGFKVYPTRAQPASATGVRAWTQVIIPRAPSSTNVPALSWSVFNPQREEFETLRAGPFPLELDAQRPVAHTRQVYLEPEGPAADTGSGLPIHGTIREWLGDEENRIQAESYFISGNEAYKEGRLTEAIDAYSKILMLGFRNPEVDANLGAACSRAGQAGKGMLFLTRALRIRPRDGIARAHLDLLRSQRPDLEGPALPPWSRLTRTEWRRLAAVAVILLVPLLFAPASRWSRLALLPLVLILAAGVGAIGWWTLGPPDRERVATAPVQGRAAPSDLSAATVRLPEGTVAYERAARPGWIHVRAGGRTAWVPAPALEKP